MVKPRVAVPGSKGRRALMIAGISSASAMLGGTDMSVVSPAMLSEIGRRAPTGELSEDGMGFLCRAGAGTGSSAKATSFGRSPLLESKLKY